MKIISKFFWFIRSKREQAAIDLVNKCGEDLARASKAITEQEDRIEKLEKFNLELINQRDGWRRMFEEEKKKSFFVPQGCWLDFQSKIGVE